MHWQIEHKKNIKIIWSVKNDFDETEFYVIKTIYLRFRNHKYRWFRTS